MWSFKLEIGEPYVPFFNYFIDKNFKQRSYIFRLLLKQNNGNVISFQDEVRANTADWSSLGMHGNQSGPLVCDSTVTEDQLIGQYG